jgi:hypothetical protein
LQPTSPALLPELLRGFKSWAGTDGVFRVPTLTDLSVLLRHAAVQNDLQELGIRQKMTLYLLTSEHRRYLQWHCFA